jgi:hypothetical protein
VHLRTHMCIDYIVSSVQCSYSNMRNSIYTVVKVKSIRVAL